MPYMVAVIMYHVRKGCFTCRELKNFATKPKPARKHLQQIGQSHFRSKNIFAWNMVHNKKVHAQAPADKISSGVGAPPWN